MRCTKGTYIRVLAMDIGRALGCGAHLAALRRTGAGPFRLEDALTLEAVEARPAEALERLLPPEVLVAGLPRLDLDADGRAPLRAGAGGAGRRGRGGAGGRRPRPGAIFLGVGRRAGDQVLPQRLLAGEGSAELPDFA